MVKKIDTDSTSDHGQDTICALVNCKMHAEHRGQLFSAFRRTDEVCQDQVGNLAACDGPPFTRVSCFCRGLLTVMVGFNIVSSI